MYSDFLYSAVVIISLNIRQNASVIKVGVVNVDVRISSHLKEELAWAVDKRLWVISTIMLFKKTVEVLRS